ncbi:MAG: hypothetical protein HUK22_04450, partial [Thermoguttaceae bacterium]|nr:hypothetical protein [Thermoguttaceae bacterium]
FKAFFQGDDEGAFALLTRKAQDAAAEDFVAAANDAVKWNIVRKTAPQNDRVFVFVEVQDYDENGAVQTEELTFELRDDDSHWRVAGFSVGDVAIDYENKRIDSVAQGGDAPGAMR